ncbi:MULTISPECIES: acetylornithine transaminase [Protofrankia]|uniref:Acetylornithine aminotransferase n=1 Tax=Protofrankia coriariae TaxID=1562887 RepID=A0ABR5F0H8_9ACTN|nr:MULTISPECIES: acetylornithine transaminase [Protofrankia]KLL10226.1 acetylornithine aminotransferase [Protofrankia coriariae]ONH34575.1 acetylornithine aminotransferase [Protofrankia sp. BMG5.30]
MNDDLLNRRDAVIMTAYGRPPIALERGAGTRVWDADGRAYLDLIAGVAVSVLGHCHPAVQEAVRDQIGRLGHVSNLYVNEPQIVLAERLLGLLGGADGRVFFCNSGAEANEAAIKISRRTGREEIVAAEGSFHGRTLGALSITGQPSKRAPFEPLLPGARFVPYGDAAALADAVGERTAAVFLEPTLGEGGVVAPPVGYLKAAREICDRAGALLVLDEVQSGIGRAGAWFLHQVEGVVPDVVTLAKGLGGGLPIGACVGFGPAGKLLRPGEHGSTFGGGPVICAAALAVLDTIERDGLIDNAVRVGGLLADGIRGAGAAGVTGVRGRGLWLAIELDAPFAAAFETAAREAGFLVNAVSADAVRLAPPLVLSAADADEFVAALPAIADQAVTAASADRTDGAAGTDGTGGGAVAGSARSTTGRSKVSA